MADTGKYFVVNEDENDTAPKQLHFCLEDAINDDALYIDVFDENGAKLHYYERIEGEYIRQAV